MHGLKVLRACTVVSVAFSGFKSLSVVLVFCKEFSRSNITPMNVV
jgi:hypothetical protein